VKDDQTSDESSYSISTLAAVGVPLSDPEKPEALADNLEAQFQPVTDSSVPAVIETVDLALKTYFIRSAGEPHLITPDEVHEGIWGPKVSKAPCPNGVPNGVSKHLPRRAVSLLARIFNRVLRTHLFPLTWKHS